MGTYQHIVYSIIGAAMSVHDHYMSPFVAITCEKIEKILNVIIIQYIYD